MIWVSSTDGLDSYNNIVVSGDGMVSRRDGWLGVGPIRGPRAFDDAPSNGKTRPGRRCVGRNTSYSYGCF
jgi:hypothetical protein